MINSDKSLAERIAESNARVLASVLPHKLKVRGSRLNKIQTGSHPPGRGQDAAAPEAMTEAVADLPPSQA